MSETQKQLRSAGSPGTTHGKGAGLYAPNSNTHLFDRFAVVVKYYKAVAAVFVLVVAGWMYQTYTTIPMYRAQARLQIDEEHTTQTADFKEPYLTYSDPEPYYQTQYRVLQGRDLARRAVRRLKLENVPEFNGTGPTPTRLTRIIDMIKARAVAPFSGGAQPAATAAPAGDTDDSGLVGGFQGRVQVTPVRSSRLVDVAFTSADPDFAARAVNVLAEEYVQQNLEFRLENTQKSLEWLTQEVAKQQDIVQASERLLAEYREHQNALSLEDRQNIVGARLNQVNDAVTRAKTQRCTGKSSKPTIATRSPRSCRTRSSRT
jgi:succinoglycan biosynthesis transport protein ExoP